MATKTIMVIYKGYVGDANWGGFRGIGDVVQCPIPAAKMSCLKYVDWLAQKGFGPGYYNNSGRYAVAYKAKLPEGVDVLESMGTELFTDADAFKARWAELKAHAKRQNKAHPY